MNDQLDPRSEEIPQAKISDKKEPQDRMDVIHHGGGGSKKGEDNEQREV